LRGHHNKWTIFALAWTFRLGRDTRLGAEQPGSEGGRGPVVVPSRRGSTQRQGGRMNPRAPIVQRRVVPDPAP